MCGIAGVISLELTDGKAVRYKKKLLHALQHRGPDGDGSWASMENGLLMVHRRLSIHDLSSTGAQPMHSASSRYCIVFNGEIYNYLELSQELLSKGRTFRGNSDTEVLLASIEQWGLDEAVKKFSGMFAFALWDKKSCILHLCRDRLGEKPLYYGWVGSDFYFASELHAIEAVCPSNILTINRVALSGYLKYGYIASPCSIYEGIYKLPPSTILSLTRTQIALKDSAIQPHPYWSLLDTANYGLSNPITDFNLAVETLNSALTAVIKRQLVADVDVGLFLSGGIDSTAVTAIAQHVSPNQVKTFTIGFHEKKYDESGYAEKIARQLGTDHTTLYLSTEEARDVIPDLSKIYSEPFADSSQIPAYLVSKLAKKNVTVCLSGDGGDELFAGYNRYLLTQRIWEKIGMSPHFARNFLAALLEKTPVTVRNSIVSTLYKNNQGSMHNKIQKLISLLQAPDILSAYDSLSSYWSRPQQLVKGLSQEGSSAITLPRNTGFIDQAMYIDQARYLEGDNLAKTDRASMAVSLETRLPLLSHEIVELAWQIPLQMKVHNNTSKWVLRNVLYKYIPDELINRPKMGFSVPIAQWLRNELRDWAEDLLSIVETGNDEHLQSAPVMAAWHEHQSGKYDHANRLWTILMFLDWKKHRSL
ncbi:MAG: asparagine synthase (glutamine-hydrolyzing) [Gammaproteobacteria bacterium]|nr:asparagine synthase (glutamine-hydrolyzing) [Gammaproteobacteria bacterium]